ncbi:MAG TPA: SgcJ/EcaC family oxidoreductase [Sulfuricaulis sp.]|nr:SgcJ/EcaC family oxidoreductase [Sulfuricaulis sp.]
MSTDTSKVTGVVNAFAAAWNRHDMEAFAQLFAADAEFVNVVGLWWKGRAEIRQAHEATHASMFKNSRLTILDTSVRFPLPQLAIARSRWRLEGHVGPDGQALPPRTGILLNVLTVDDGSWAIIDSQNTDVVEGVLSRPQ